MFLIHIMQLNTDAHGRSKKIVFWKGVGGGGGCLFYIKIKLLRGVSTQKNVSVKINSP
jgi:hypothetical protein